jgi:hypothetical protein
MSKTPDIEKQMYGMIEFLSKEDLVDLVRDALVMKTDTIENAIKSSTQIKIRIAETLSSPEVIEAYFNSLLGEVPSHDTESNNE